MARSKAASRTARLTMFAGALYGAWQFVFKPWEQSWGATKFETREPLPGDDIVPNPRIDTTRAISIDATVDEVWPWLVQMGQGRGGFYSYEAPANLFGAGLRNASEILPEFQQLASGDIIRLTDGDGPYLRVTAIEPGRSLVLSGRMDDEGREIPEDQPLPQGYTLFSWSFYLVPASDGGSRLLVRSRYEWSRGAVNSLLWRLAVEPAQFIMERGMLLGIRQRAERGQPSELPRFEEPLEERRAA